MGIGVHQLAILQGSEVAHVERALVRAPAAFLGFEAHKEGHHFRSCKPGFPRLFVSWLRPCHFTQFTAPDWSGSSRKNGLVQPSDHPVAPRTTVGSSRRSELGSRSDHRRITSRYHAQTVVDLFRSAKFDQHSNPLAAPNLGSPAPAPPRSHCEETKNKKSARIATFLRLAIVMGSSDRGSRCKSAGNRLFSSVFPL